MSDKLVLMVLYFLTSYGGRREGGPTKKIDKNRTLQSHQRFMKPQNCSKFVMNGKKNAKPHQK